MKSMKQTKNTRINFYVEDDCENGGRLYHTKQSAIEELHRRLGDRRRARLIREETTTITTDITNEVIK